MSRTETLRDSCRIKIDPLIDNKDLGPGMSAENACPSDKFVSVYYPHHDPGGDAHHPAHGSGQNGVFGAVPLSAQSDFGSGCIADGKVLFGDIAFYKSLDAFCSNRGIFGIANGGFSEGDDIFVIALQVSCRFERIKGRFIFTCVR